MENKQISNEILIAGIEIRTTFINGKHFKDIGELWQKVMSHNELQKIPCTKDKSLYCIYYDYENEDKGEYSVMIGMEVSNIQEMPQNFKIMRIIPGKMYGIPQKQNYIEPLKPILITTQTNKYSFLLVIYRDIKVTII